MPSLSESVKYGAFFIANPSSADRAAATIVSPGGAWLVMALSWAALASARGSEECTVFAARLGKLSNAETRP